MHARTLSQAKAECKTATYEGIVRRKDVARQSHVGPGLLSGRAPARQGRRWRLLCMETIALTRLLFGQRDDAPDGKADRTRNAENDQRDLGGRPLGLLLEPAERLHVTGYRSK